MSVLAPLEVGAAVVVADAVVDADEDAAEVLVEEALVVLVDEC